MNANFLSSVVSIASRGAVRRPEASDLDVPATQRRTLLRPHTKISNQGGRLSRWKQLLGFEVLALFPTPAKAVWREA
ncbi:hypothetical protein Ct61P_01368 [Colletotrichum tofieldiae]|nr:hypothetical protein Ct61P_01368 [Colletotrichum tofieldiae]